MPCSLHLRPPPLWWWEVQAMCLLAYVILTIQKPQAELLWVNSCGSTGSTLMDRRGLSWKSRLPESAALFFPVGLATVNISHSGWKFFPDYLWSAEREFYSQRDHRKVCVSGGGFPYVQIYLPSGGGLWNAVISFTFSLSLNWAQPPCGPATQAQLLSLLSSLLRWVCTWSFCCGVPGPQASKWIASGAFVPVSNPFSSPLFTPMYPQISQSTDLSDIFVYWARNLLLNYSYSTCCNFKGRDLEFLSCCHAADITQE